MMTGQLDMIKSGWNSLGELSADLIVKTILLDMQPFFAQLFTEKWMRSVSTA